MLGGSIAPLPFRWSAISIGCRYRNPILDHAAGIVSVGSSGSADSLPGRKLLNLGAIRSLWGNTVIVWELIRAVSLVVPG